MVDEAWSLNNTWKEYFQVKLEVATLLVVESRGMGI
jgi:hypothetical protein